jgi:hypothetical protein
VINVEQELNTELSDDISAASSAAIIRPDNPGGISRFTSIG